MGLAVLPITQMPLCHRAAVQHVAAVQRRLPKSSQSINQRGPDVLQQLTEGKAWHVQSKRQHPPCWPTPAFTAAQLQVPSHCIHTAPAVEENILRAVDGSQPPPVMLSGSHMAQAGDEEMTENVVELLLRPDGSCGGGCY